MSKQPQFNLVEELTWRELVHNVIPETEPYLAKNTVKGYIGFDPTADSLHVGNLVPVFLLRHLQRAGHQPIVLVGGATGLIGDPSGKSAERNLLDKEQINRNLEGIKKQLSKFLDFDKGENPAILVNNYDWFEKLSFLDFIRDVGKHITVSYMMAKDSVKNRLETGISFTEFSYQLIQGYDFLQLYRTMGCKLQMGGSDQWGNITTGTELIRRIEGGDAYALTAPLLTKSDGSKFGKSEGGNVWLDSERTSPYAFYQFWLNTADDEVEKLIKIFTNLEKEKVAFLIKQHQAAPHERLLQKTLAKELTILVHSEEAYEMAVKTSQVLFGNATLEDLLSIGEKNFLSAMDGIPEFSISKSQLNSLDVVSFLAVETSILPSKGEARKMIQANAISINKAKVTDVELLLDASFLLFNQFILVQKGKKSYFLVRVVN